MQALLDAVISYLPSPLDVPAIKGHDVKDAEKIIERKASDDEPFSALAFKIASDPFSGVLTFIRVYSGKLEVGKATNNSVKSKKEKISKLLLMHANKREEIQSVSTGEIAAVIRPSFHGYRRYPLRRNPSDSPGEDGFSRAGDLHGDRTENPGRE